MSMRLALALAAVAAVTVATPAGAGRAARPLLALELGRGAALDAPSRLVRVDPSTMRPTGRGLRLPCWAFGFRAAWSPAGDAVAVVPKPDERSERVHLVDAASLRLRSRVGLEGHDVCALAWPAPRAIVALAGEQGCYNRQRRLLALRIDPVAKRIVARTAVPVEGSVDAVANVPGGVAGLVGRTLVVFTTVGVRRVELPGASPAAAIAATRGGRIFVAGFDGSVVAVERDGHFEVHRWRSTSAVAKDDQRVVSAAWLGADTLAIGRGRLRVDGSVPLGARLVDTSTWRVRARDATAIGVVGASGRVVAYGADGLRLYSRTGRLLRRALRGAHLRSANVQGRYAYAAEERGADVVDLATRRESRGSADANLFYGLLLP
jgi:hypothetical protein